MPSSVIRAFAYDLASRSLPITFTSGRRYRYHGVPAETYEAMRAAFSKGEFFNKHIKDHFPFTREA
jgi:hypothetical protein